MIDPVFSIVLPTNNRKEYFKNALSSILNQKNGNWELIIINDGNDNVQDIIPRDERIRYIKNKNTIGASASRNIGVKVSRGDFIAYLDDDDEWLPEHLSLSQNILYSYDFIYSGSKINKNGKLSPWYNEKFSYKKLAQRNFIPTPSVIHRRDLIYKAGLWDEKLNCLQDWDLWCRMLLKIKIDRIYHRDNITVIVNWGDKTITTKSIIENIRKKTIFYIKSKYYIPLLFKHIKSRKDF